MDLCKWIDWHMRRRYVYGKRNFNNTVNKSQHWTRQEAPEYEQVAEMFMEYLDRFEQSGRSIEALPLDIKNVIKLSYKKTDEQTWITQELEQVFERWRTRINRREVEMDNSETNDGDQSRVKSTVPRTLETTAWAMSQVLAMTKRNERHG